MKEPAATENLVFGRDEDDWDLLAEAGEAFLIERARLGRLTSYTELNAVLVNRTGLRHFDFELQADRTAMGHLLGLIVARNRSVTGLMISALVIYLGGNDAGSGFYKLAQDLGELPPAHFPRFRRRSSGSIRSRPCICITGEVTQRRVFDTEDAGGRVR